MSTTGNSIIWSGIERFSVQGIQFVLSLIIARLIMPSQYGLIAMISIFMALAQTLVDSGFGNALIQKKDRTQVDYSTVFYFNFILSIILYIVLFFSAPLIAQFYQQPQLLDIIRWAGLNIIIMGLAIIQRTRLTISLNFKLLARISLLSVIVGGVVGVIMAYNSYGVWALVFQTLISNLLQTFLLWFLNKWLPSLVCSMEAFKKLFGFGYKLLLSGVLQTIFVNMYSLVIGKVYNSRDVGLYNRAYTISQYPSTNLTQIITRVIYPIQCEHQSEKGWLENSFLEFVRLSCFVIFPIMTFICISSKSLVLIILADNWLPCAPMVSILCLAYIWLPIGTLNNHLILSQGASGEFLKAEVIKKIVAVIIMLITLPFGVIYLCYGLVIYNIVDVAIIIYFTKKFFDLGFVRQTVTILPIVIVTSVAAVTAYFIGNLCYNEWSILIISFFIFTITYLILSRFFLMKEIRIVSNLVLRFLKKT